MVKQGTPPFHILSINPPGVNPSLLPLSSAAVLTDQPGAIKQADLESPEALAARLKKEATKRNVKGIRLTDPITLGRVSALGEEMANFPDSFYLGVTARLDSQDDCPVRVPSSRSGIKLVEWIHPKGRIASLTQVLKAFSKAGIWNHVRVSTERDRHIVEPVMRFTIANPNIVHSWAVMEPGHSSLVGPLNLIDPFFSTYSRYSPLPGRPFWQYVSDSVHLLQYLVQYGLKKMIRWWVPAGERSLITLGENLAYHFVKPQALSPKRLDDICQMVEAGGSVGSQWVRYNLERAFLIAYVTEMDVVVASSSLKHPRPEYIAVLNQQAGMDLSSYLERGYTSVRPEYRGMGIGTRLLDGLTSRVGDWKVFSLIGEDNIATQKIALRNRTRKVSTFFSRKTGKQMGIWIPEAMLDTP